MANTPPPRTPPIAPCAEAEQTAAAQGDDVRAIANASPPAMVTEDEALQVASSTASRPCEHDSPSFAEWSGKQQAGQGSRSTRRQLVANQGQSNR